MEFLLKVVDESIPGIIYLLAISFFLLRYFKQHDLIIFKKRYRRVYKEDDATYKNIILYIIIFMIFIAHIINGMAQTLFSHIWQFKMAIPQDFAILIDDNKLKTRIAEIYGQIVIYRHLMFSIILLGCSLHLWIEDKENRRRSDKVFFGITTFIFVVLLLITCDFSLLKKDSGIISIIKKLICFIY